MLEVRKLQVRYGAIAAVRGIDLDIRTGEIVALIGANVAGKSTIARAIAGLLPYRGEIRYEGRLLQPNHAERNLRAGIALVPEGRGVLAQMSVEENLLVAERSVDRHGGALQSERRVFPAIPPAALPIHHRFLRRETLPFLTRNP